jgi:hypothetical protein
MYDLQYWNKIHNCVGFSYILIYSVYSLKGFNMGVTIAIIEITFS